MTVGAWDLSSLVILASLVLGYSSLPHARERTTMTTSLLHYRPWRGRFHTASWTVWPLPRVSVGMVFRRKIFGGLYSLGLLIFFMFFFGQYLLAWTEAQVAGLDDPSQAEVVRIGLVRAEPTRLIGLLKEVMNLNGTAYTY